ncbi:MAG: SRPBCC domain-containing protein [Armatimonadetes bacterium]|nr:SRPBCC domain-containing protein [Armatimonadota bacterium]
MSSRVQVEVLAETAVRLSCFVGRPPERVYDAWLDPNEIVRWFVPEPGCACTVHDLDARPGGRFRISVLSPDAHTARAEYKLLDRPNKIVLSWSWENSGPEGVVSQITLEFRPQGEGTLLVLTHEQLADAESRDLHVIGWTGCLTSISDYLAPN